MIEIVLNRDFGGFSLPKGFVEQEKLSDRYADVSRTSEKLIRYIKEHGSEDSDLEVIEIPDNVTDWQIHEYDGLESIICVIDGKIHWLH